MAIAIVALVGTFLSTQPTPEAETYGQQFDLPAEQLDAAATTVGATVQQYLVGEGILPPPRPAWTVWDRLADCESSGRWHIDAYHDGGLQFLPSTWTAYGGGKYARYAWQATREQQIDIAQKVQAAAGWGQWPVCSRRLGLR